MSSAHTLSRQHDFPSDFVWGVATSSFQIEGAAHADGKGPSIWDTFCQVPGAIADASDGLIACEHYERWQEDVNLIASLGVNAYRFSISWPRVQPTGVGAWSEACLTFYEDLVNGLWKRNIKRTWTESPSLLNMRALAPNYLKINFSPFLAL